MTKKESSQPSQSTKKPLDIKDFSTYSLPTSTQEPNALAFDDHEFRINYDVPPHITKALYELFDRGAEYEDVSEELRKYEIDDNEDDIKDDRNAKKAFNAETAAKTGKESSGQIS